MENSKCEQPDKSVSLENVEEVFGYSINELYKIAIKFYKGTTIYFLIFFMFYNNIML